MVMLIVIVIVIVMLFLFLSLGFVGDVQRMTSNKGGMVGGGALCTSFLRHYIIYK
jgi:hypothetical protein